MKLDDIASKIFSEAYSEAKLLKHEYLTPEHILYASLFFDEGRKIIENTGGNVETLKAELKNYLKNNIDEVEDVELTESSGLQNIINSTGRHILSCGKDVITIGDIIVSIFDEEKSFASYFLRKEGIERIDILNYISHNNSKINMKSENYNSKSNDKGVSDQNEDSFKSYVVDLNQKALSGKFDPLIGREDIVQRTLQILCRRVKNNPIHVGEAGVGKTAITEGIAKLIVEDKVPDILKGSKIYSMDMASMLAGTKYRGDFEERIKKVLNQISKQEKSIVYIDEIHTIVGAGSISGGAMDASNILKPFLTEGNIKFIGSTTYDEYKKYFEKDRALSRRFQKVDVLEPSIEDAVKILNGLKASYEAFHNVFYTKEAIEKAVELSSKYIHDRFLPDKAIDVIDEAGAYVRLIKSNGHITITEKDIEKVISTMAKIPEKNISQNENEKLKNLDKLLSKEIFGQKNAIDIIVKSIKRSRAGFNEEQKPVASLLFVGPTGVGKTEIAKQLSIIFGIPLIRFDMSEYQEKHAVARLIGSPPGYVGYEEGGLLTESIKKTPYCVLLLDEIEKVHPDILNVLLQIMDYATLTDNTGKKADFQNVILIMTSNAGARDLGKTMIGFGKRTFEDEIIVKEVERIFSPEFRNRLNDIVVFNRINEEMALLIAKKAITKFKGKLTEKNIELIVTDECLMWLAEKGFSSIYGAREIFRIVDQEIKTFFIDEVLFGSLSKGGKALINIKNGNVNIEKVEKELIEC
ncbi:MAG: ATP-dependent Clp protease ATP-binding subunit ClpA [Bacillota bacterium]|nr:ATP-dependent Clp protease ATP-binding subunit ClpA [Bacillota bacterium]